MTEAHSPDGEPSSESVGFRQHVKAHARGFVAVVVASAIGIVATFVFQVASARYLAPSDFGLFSAFLVIVNVAAVGSSALQNHVTVQTATALSVVGPPSPMAKKHWPIEALIIGVSGGAAVALLSPLLAGSLDTTVALILAASCTIPLSFLFADSLGLLQGAGRITSAVWWSTSSQLLRVVSIGLVIVLGAGLGGVVASVIVAVGLTVLGGMWSSRRIPRPPGHVFGRSGMTIVALTVSFAWLTSADVLLMRAGAAAEITGIYAATTVLVKAGFLLPSTLALYLLPRFVRNRSNPALTRVGVLATLGVSLGTSVAMIAFFAVAGGWLVALIYGTDYQRTAELLVPVTVAYLPWMAAQGLLIKMTASSSASAALLLLCMVPVQWVALTLAIPDLPSMIISLGLIGGVVLIGFLLIECFVIGRRAPSDASDERRGRRP